MSKQTIDPKELEKVLGKSNVAILKKPLDKAIAELLGTTKFMIAFQDLRGNANLLAGDMSLSEAAFLVKLLEIDLDTRIVNQIMGPAPGPSPK